MIKVAEYRRKTGAKYKWILNTEEDTREKVAELQNKMLQGLAIKNRSRSDVNHTYKKSRSGVSGTVSRKNDTLETNLQCTSSSKMTDKKIHIRRAKEIMNELMCKKDQIN